MNDEKLCEMTEDEILEWFAECEMKASVLGVSLEYYMFEFV